MDNCSGHKVKVTLERLKIVSLPARSTAKHQPLDLGVIANAKIRYRSALLSAVWNVIEKRRTTQEQILNDSGNGRYGIREGQLPHVADAMVLFNNAWSAVSRMAICEFWIKSECLGVQHTQSLQSVIQSLSLDDDVNIDLTSSNNLKADGSTNVIDTQTIHSVHNALPSNRLMVDEPSTPLHEILEAVRNLEAKSDLM